MFSKLIPALVICALGVGAFQALPADACGGKPCPTPTVKATKTPTKAATATKTPSPTKTATPAPTATCANLECDQVFGTVTATPLGPTPTQIQKPAQTPAVTSETKTSGPDLPPGNQGPLVQQVEPVIVPLKLPETGSGGVLPQ